MLSLSACSSDDENNLNPIVGIWYFFSKGGIEISNFNKKSTIIFNKNGTFSCINYGSQNNVNNCAIENTTKGTWSYRDKGNYEITASYETT